MAAPLVVNVAELFRGPGSVKEISVRVEAAVLAFDDPRITDRDVEVSVRLESASDGIVVTGRAEAHGSDVCRRCLREVTGPVEAVIDDVFVHESADPEAWRIVEAQVDLAPMAREAILLALPAAPLCRPDCPGLCPQCGADLSEGPCGCASAPADDRWSALDALRERLPDAEA